MTPEAATYRARLDAERLELAERLAREVAKGALGCLTVRGTVALRVAIGARTRQDVHQAARDAYELGLVRLGGCVYAGHVHTSVTAIHGRAA